jgi:hypothetical protein
MTAAGGGPSSLSESRDEVPSCTCTKEATKPLAPSGRFGWLGLVWRFGQHAKNGASQVIGGAAPVGGIDEQPAGRGCVEATTQLLDFVIAKDIVQPVAADDYAIALE